MRRTIAAFAALAAVTTLTAGRAQAQQRRRPATPAAATPQATPSAAATQAQSETQLLPVQPYIGPEYLMLGRIFEDTTVFKSSYAQNEILPALIAKYPPVNGYDVRRRIVQSYGAPLGCEWMMKAIQTLGADQGVTVETFATPDVGEVTRVASKLKGRDFLLIRCSLPSYINAVRPDLRYAGTFRTQPGGNPSAPLDNLSCSRWVFKIGAQTAPTNYGDVVTPKDTITLSDHTGRAWKQPIGELWAWLMATREFIPQENFINAVPDKSFPIVFRFEMLIVHIPEKMAASALAGK